MLTTEKRQVVAATGSYAWMMCGHQSHQPVLVGQTFDKCVAGHVTYKRGAGGLMKSFGETRPEHMLIFVNNSKSTSEGITKLSQGRQRGATNNRQGCSKLAHYEQGLCHIGSLELTQHKNTALKY